MVQLDGINLAMQTPMHADGSIDYARWEALIDIYIDAGVQGLVLGAGTGQHPYCLSPHRRSAFLSCRAAAISSATDPTKASSSSPSRGLPGAGIRSRPEAILS